MCGRSNEAVLWAASAFSALFPLIFFIFLLQFPLLKFFPRVRADFAKPLWLDHYHAQLPASASEYVRTF